MAWFSEFWRRLRALGRRGQIDADLDAELRLHMELRAEQQVKAGAPPDEARYAAERRMGNRILLKEAGRDVWRWVSLETFLQDVRYGARMLRKSPVFTLVAVASLALGIGANTAIFSLVDTILLKSLPVRNPEGLRLVLWTGQSRIPMKGGSGYSTMLHGVHAHSSFSYAMYKQMAANVPQFSDLAGFARSTVTVFGGGESHYAGAFFVTGNYFRTLGVNALLGRTLAAEDDRAGAVPVAVITYAYWERRFGLDPGIVGRDITINGRPVTVVGVTRRSFAGLEPGRSYDLFLPIAFTEVFGPKWYLLGRDDEWWVQVVGRLQPGIPDQQARAGLDVVMQRASAAYPENPKRKGAPWRPVVEPGDGGVPMVRQQASTPLFILSGVVGLVLLIACANIANLLLARGTARRREIAVRLSIGAGRWRLIRQLLTESLLLSGLGAAIGLSFASPLAKAVLAMAVGNEPLAFEISLDARALLFTTGIALLTGLLFGLAPAFRATRLDLGPALKAGGVGASGEGSRLRMSRLLVVGQVALSTLLLAGAGLFVRTLVNLSRMDPGFNASHVLIFTVDGSNSGYKAEKLTDLYERIRLKIAVLPGVLEATLSDVPLIADSMSSSDLTIPGYTPKSGQVAGTYHMSVGRRFLTTMGIPILIGRDIDGHDTVKSVRVAVVNESFAKKYFAGHNPLGRIFYFGRPGENPEAAGGKRDPKDTFEVVGVCKDAKYDNLKHEIPPTVYLAYLQNPGWMREATFEIRTAVPPLALASTVRRAVADLDRTVPLANMRTQEDQIQLSLGMERMFATLVGSFGLLAAALAALGLYGVLAYAVARRTAEIGIRIALGAGSGDVLWMVLRDSLLMVAIGVLLGVPAALGVTQLLRDVIFGIAPNDPLSFVAAGALMLASATAAAWIPGRRATRVDPMQALRQE